MPAVTEPLRLELVESSLDVSEMRETIEGLSKKPPMHPLINKKLSNFRLGRGYKRDSFSTEHSMNIVSLQ
jgi:hypothetical protein